LIAPTLYQASIKEAQIFVTLKTSEANKMFLSKLYIENYRSIQKLDLKFTKGKNVIVGKNNAGKSNIIRAIDLVLGEKSPTWDKADNIMDNDFFEGNINNEIFIWCELIKNDNEILDLSEYSGAFFKLLSKPKYVPLKKNIEFSQKESIFEFCSEEGQEKCDSNFYSKKWIGSRKYCRTSFNEEFAEINNFAFAFRCRKEDDKYIRHSADVH
jgi:putative ATP-dependent endonuclease of the OLD family